MVALKTFHIISPRMCCAWSWIKRIYNSFLFSVRFSPEFLIFEEHFFIIRLFWHIIYIYIWLSCVFFLFKHFRFITNKYIWKEKFYWYSQNLFSFFKLVSFRKNFNLIILISEISFEIFKILCLKLFVWDDFRVSQTSNESSAVFLKRYQPIGGVQFKNFLKYHN